MQETLIVVNSDPRTGSKNLTSDGSSFYVDFSERLRTEGMPTLKVLSASIWFNFPNIKTAINDTLKINFGNDGSQGGSTFTNTVMVTVPQGLYGISQFSSTVSEALHDSQYGTELGLESVVFTPNYATNKAQVTLDMTKLIETTSANYLEVDFLNSSVASLIGFTQTKRFTHSYGSTIKSDLFEGDTIADMAPIDSLQLKCSAARGSIINGAMSSDTVAAIPILAEPSHQILYSPYQAPRTPCPAFVQGVNRMRMSLCDQRGDPVNTNGEYWSAALLLEW